MEKRAIFRGKLLTYYFLRDKIIDVFQKILRDFDCALSISWIARKEFMRRPCASAE